MKKVYLRASNKKVTILFDPSNLFSSLLESEKIVH